MAKYIAVDLGASNGRVIVGDFSSFEVMNRFVTRNEDINGEVFWDIPYIFGEIKKGLKEAFKQFGTEISSIGIDSWGVDHALLDSHDSLISLPYHYRDSRTDKVFETVCMRLGTDEIFNQTGVAFNTFNTLYQLAALQQDRPSVFQAAHTYLSIPDLLNFWLTGVKANELTHASTTQMINIGTRSWAWPIIDEMGFPRTLFGPIVDSRTVLGPLTVSLQHELGADSSVQVVAVGSHDTASAVAAVPTETNDFLYISSGTWSLLGTETDKPILHPFVLESGFTNEIGANGHIRLLKNIMGMWIQQECIRYWESMGETLSWNALDAETLQCSGFGGVIDPLDTRFLKPNFHGSLMVDRIKDQCREKGCPIPSSKGEYMVAIYRGLADAYAKSVANLAKLAQKNFTDLYIIGGGCKNHILNQWTADATRLDVHAGPAEATALGNMLAQAVALAHVASFEQGRMLIRKAQQITTFPARYES